MSLSITTSVPSGTIGGDWCLQNLEGFGGTPNQCADPAKHQKPSDFDTICCAGDIISKPQNLWDYHRLNRTQLNLEDLVCCLYADQPLNSNPSMTSDAHTCPQGSPTPLASLAATNTENAVLYRRTYTSAGPYSWTGATGFYGDYVPVATPRCLWVYTKGGISMSEVTLPAATISAMSVTSTSSSNTSLPTMIRPSMTADDASHVQETTTTTSGTLTLTLPASLGGGASAEPTATQTAVSTTSSSGAIANAECTTLPVLMLAGLAITILKGS